jgi:hypothetical protein
MRCFFNYLLISVYMNMLRSSFVTKFQIIAIFNKNKLLHVN